MWEWVRRAVLHSLSTAFLRLWKWVRAFWYKNGLLTLSMLSVVTGCLLGFLLRALELTDLVSLAGMVMGVSEMEWGRGASPGASKGPRWAQPQKQINTERKKPLSSQHIGPPQPKNEGGCKSSDEPVWTTDSKKNTCLGGGV